MEYYELVDPDLARYVEEEVTEARQKEDGTVVFPAGSYWIGDGVTGLDSKNPDFDEMRSPGPDNRGLKLNRFGICVGWTRDGDGSYSVHRCDYEEGMGEVFKFVWIGTYDVDCASVAIIPAELTNNAYNEDCGVGIKSAVPFRVTQSKKEWLLHDEVDGDLILHIQI